VVAIEYTRRRAQRAWIPADDAGDRVFFDPLLEGAHEACGMDRRIGDVLADNDTIGQDPFAVRLDKVAGFDIEPALGARANVVDRHPTFRSTVRRHHEDTALRAGNVGRADRPNGRIANRGVEPERCQVVPLGEFGEPAVEFLGRQKIVSRAIAGVLTLGLVRPAARRSA
jgi:hypothetical protein